MRSIVWFGNFQNFVVHLVTLSLRNCASFPLVTVTVVTFLLVITHEADLQIFGKELNLCSEDEIPILSQIDKT